MLEKLKIMLGITDSGRDELLNLLIESATARLKTLLGGIEPPASLEYIVRDVSIIRFNRIGSEGMTSHTVEGESQQFSDSDFDGFRDDIQSFLESQKDSARGRVRFL